MSESAVAFSRAGHVLVSNYSNSEIYPKYGVSREFPDPIPLEYLVQAKENEFMSNFFQ